MKNLTELARDVVKSDNAVDLMHAEHPFIEALTFASYPEIASMLETMFAEDFIGFPVWARNLSFRLACLLEPNNALIRRRAAGDLHDFGPDWEKEVERLYREADEIEGRGHTH